MEESHNYQQGDLHHSNANALRSDSELLSWDIGKTWALHWLLHHENTYQHCQATGWGKWTKNMVSPSRTSITVSVLHNLVAVTYNCSSKKDLYGWFIGEVGQLESGKGLHVQNQAEVCLGGAQPCHWAACFHQQQPPLPFTLRTRDIWRGWEMWTIQFSWGTKERVWKQVPWKTGAHLREGKWKFLSKYPWVRFYKRQFPFSFLHRDSYLIFK